MPKSLNTRRTVNGAVRHRVVTKTAVRTPATEIKNTRKLARTSNDSFDKRKEAALVALHSLEKVTAVMGKLRTGMKRGLSPETSATSSVSETPERLQFVSRAASNRSRRRLRQFLEYTEFPRLVRVSWNFARCRPGQQDSTNRVGRSSWSGPTTR